jgi:mono/diheme cytochrome c family protein
MSQAQNLHRTTKLVGLVAQFDDPDSLVHACEKARNSGYTQMDAYTPFPIHGIDDAMGIRRTKLPFIVLAVALGAVCLGLGMQYYTNAVEESPLFPGYAFKISGKPIFSLPANIPVTFEVIVLSSAFATFFGMWLLNGLPRLSNPLHRIERFKRVTNDKFFMMIPAEDAKFERGRTESQLKEWGASAIDECVQDLSDTRMPSWVKMAGVLLAVLLLLPPVAIFRAAGQKSRLPRLHFNPDMDWQIKYKAQTLSPVMGQTSQKRDLYLFEDSRSSRRPVAGSVAWGKLVEDVEMLEGIRSDYQGDRAEDDLSQYVTGFPAGIVVDEDFVRRGKQRYEIYCSACHGYAGQGNGLVNNRAMSLNLTGQASWTAAKSLHDPEVKDPNKNPLGRIYETITHGRNTMGPYQSQIALEDRWAIVAYVKALQQLEIEGESGAVPADEPDAPADNQAGAETPGEENGDQG